MCDAHRSDLRLPNTTILRLYDFRSGDTEDLLRRLDRCISLYYQRIIFRRIFAGFVEYLQDISSLKHLGAECTQVNAYSFATTCNVLSTYNIATPPPIRYHSRTLAAVSQYCTPNIMVSIDAHLTFEFPYHSVPLSLPRDSDTKPDALQCPATLPQCC